MSIAVSRRLHFSFSDLAHFGRVGCAQPRYVARSLQALIQLVLQVNVRVPIDEPRLVELVERLLDSLALFPVRNS